MDNTYTNHIPFVLPSFEIWFCLTHWNHLEGSILILKQLLFLIYKGNTPLDLKLMMFSSNKSCYYFCIGTLSRSLIYI